VIFKLKHNNITLWELENLNTQLGGVGALSKVGEKKKKQKGGRIFGVGGGGPLGECDGPNWGAGSISPKRKVGGQIGGGAGSLPFTCRGLATVAWDSLGAWGML